MTEKSSSSFQKARDEALRALLLRGGLTPDQVAGLKLNQVHLTTGTLVIEPDQFVLSSPAEQPVQLKLDGETCRALIAWLVARPDSSNDHLFPGEGQEGLDAAAIGQVAAAKPAESPRAAAATRPATPSAAGRERPVGLPEPIVKRPPSRPVAQRPPSPGARRAEEKVPSPPSPPTRQPERGAPKERPRPVSLDEIEAMRHRLAEVYDDWSPVVSAPPARPAVRPSSEAVPWIETKPPERVTKPEIPPEPVVESPAEAEIPPSLAVEAEETLVARRVPIPARERRITPPIAQPVGPVSDWVSEVSRLSGGKITLNLSYPAVAIGGIALVAVCCFGLAIMGGMALRAGGPAGLLAGLAPATEPTEVESPVSPTLSLPSSPTPQGEAVTTTPGAQLPGGTPEPPPTATPAPTDTPTLLPATGPTPTPIIIVVTATPAPEPSPTATPVPTNTPASRVQPTPTVTPPPAFKYPAPVLLEPHDGEVVPGRLALLKWEPVGPLADDEWYAVRLVYLQQGTPVYQGDPVKVPEWWVPERFYYQADGPALEYRWFVFVERRNPDGSMTQLSPESKTFVFRWQ